MWRVLVADNLIPLSSYQCLNSESVRPNKHIFRDRVHENILFPEKQLKKILLFSFLAVYESYCIQ